MNDDEILFEIQRTRESHAAASGYDVRKLMASYREHQQRHPDAGHPVVSFVGEPAAGTDVPAPRRTRRRAVGGR
jgi:hypothetical protein